MKSQIFAFLTIALVAVIVHGKPAEETEPLGIIDQLREQLGSLGLPDEVLNQVLELVEQILLPNGELVGILELPGALNDLTDQLSSLGLSGGVVQDILQIVVNLLTSLLGVRIDLPDLPIVGDIPVLGGILGGL